MSWIEMICLANSYKIDGRCVAGLNTADGSWVRPISSRKGGALLGSECSHSLYEQVQKLQVVKLPIISAQASLHHPEDYLIDSERRWQLTGISDELLFRKIENAITHTGDLIRDKNSNISAVSVTDKNPVAASLQLIVPESPELIIATNYNGNRQYRTNFIFSGTRYNLALTDDNFTRQYSAMPIGYKILLEAPQGKRILYTVSLGELLPATNKFYKLVAGVITI